MEVPIEILQGKTIKEIGKTDAMFDEEIKIIFTDGATVIFAASAEREESAKINVDYSPKVVNFVSEWVNEPTQYKRGDKVCIKAGSYALCSQVAASKLLERDKKERIRRIAHGSEFYDFEIGRVLLLSDINGIVCGVTETMCSIDLLPLDDTYKRQWFCLGSIRKD